MPELPEVEVTARALAQRFEGHTLDRLEVLERRLRWPVPRILPGAAQTRRFERIDRRGKYLLLHTEAGVLLSHLGMSGSWRIHERGAVPPRERHDHIEFASDGAVARYNDPRRFGALLWHPCADGDVHRHPLLAGLGAEPLEPGFDGARLHAGTRGRKMAIKQVLLAGDVVVGVGNIYASEALFLARIHPAAAAGRLSPARCDRLAAAIREILQRAIAAGGSTLRDFSSVHGVAGRYTSFAQVYERAGQPCRRCGGSVRRLVQGQRASYYCPRCQRV